MNMQLIYISILFIVAGCTEMSKWVRTHLPWLPLLSLFGGILCLLAGLLWSRLSSAYFIVPAICIFLVFLVLLWRIIRKAPRAKPLLSNRKTLITSIAEFGDAAIDVITIQEELDKMDIQSPHLIPTQVVAARDDAYTSYEQTLKRIRHEKLEAGKAFDKPISDLIVFISTQVHLKVKKPSVYGGGQLPVLTPLQRAVRITEEVEKTVGKIEEIRQKGSDTADSESE